MKTALITGASRGIGKAVAERLAAEGYDLALTCRTHTDQLRTFAQSLGENTQRSVLWYEGDVADADRDRKIAEDVMKRHGCPNVIVNNAGIAHIGLIQDMTPEEWDRVIRINLSSVFYVTQPYLSAMIRRRSGHIINISSMWGSVGASCEAAYSASKGGVNALTRALAKELAPSGIRVNALACGVIDTTMNAQLNEKERKALEEEIPLGRFGSPDEVAACVSALLKSEYLTGQVIGVDGACL